MFRQNLALLCLLLLAVAQVYSMEHGVNSLVHRHYPQSDHAPAEPVHGDEEDETFVDGVDAAPGRHRSASTPAPGAAAVVIAGAEPGSTRQAADLVLPVSRETPLYLVHRTLRI